MNAVFFNEYIQTSPRFMTDFTPWTLFVDTGIISVLLLLGKLMRVKIRFIQRLFIPPSLLAGFIGHCPWDLTVSASYLFPPKQELMPAY